MKNEPEPVSHSQTFTNVVLPQLFHGSPGQFAKYLERDGTKFLHFYWNNARERLPSHLRASTFGLNYAVYEPAPRVQLFLITLPAPVVDGDAYYSALVYRPDRRILLVTDKTRLFNLERVTDEHGTPATLLVQWTTHLERVEFGPLGEPNAETYMAAVMQHLDD